ncbi:unnamed protein product [Periconia digitata]|uniref:Uncharacterized protein n=1 Tax=Periconia digitata TaxID=1303443 RepID=A0A9W4UKL4_9PLEO|nr:unnamed protein product [Periconia digitata]
MLSYLQVPLGGFVFSIILPLKHPFLFEVFQPRPLRQGSIFSFLRLTVAQLRVGNKATILRRLALKTTHKQMGIEGAMEGTRSAEYVTWIADWHI